MAAPPSRAGTPGPTPGAPPTTSAAPARTPTPERCDVRGRPDDHRHLERLHSTNPLRVATSETAATWDSPLSISTGSLRPAGRDPHRSGRFPDRDGVGGGRRRHDRGQPCGRCVQHRRRRHLVGPEGACPSGGRNWPPQLVASCRRPATRRSPGPSLDGQGNVGARTARSTDGGVTWQESVFATPATASVQDPRLAASADLQRLTIVWNEEKSPGRVQYAVVSGDGGSTWSAPKPFSTAERGHRLPERGDRRRRRRHPHGGVPAGRNRRHGSKP